MTRLGRAAEALLAAALLALVGCSVVGGERIAIPSDVPQTGYYTVTCYDDFTGRWAAGTGQRDVSNRWVEAGSPSEDGICTLGGRYLVACAGTFGEVGDDVTFELSGGIELPCTIADAKSQGDPNYTKWGHEYGGKVNIIEFEVLRSAYEGHGTNPGNPGWKDEWGGVAVEACTNHSRGVSNTVVSCSAAGIGGAGQDYESASMQQKRIVEATKSVPTTGKDMCAAWVTNVYSAAGWPGVGGDACDMYWAWCKSSNRAELEVGMLVATPSTPHGPAGRKYGHVGIYVGDGMVTHNNGGPIVSETLDDWIKHNDASSTGVRWGWPPR